MNSVVLMYLNSFAFLVLVLILKNYKHKFKSSCCEERIFLLFILSTIVMLFGETAIELLHGQPGPTVRFILYGFQTFDFGMAVVVPVLWLYYCIFRFFHISMINRRLRHLIALPAALFVLFLLVAVPTGIAFHITQNNEYKRGVAYFSSYAIGYVYIAAALILVAVKHKTLNPGELVPYLVVPLIPITLGVLEIVFVSFSGLMWPATSLVILEIQMLVLNNRTNIDHLTSLNNRMALDTYTRRLMEDHRNTDKTLAMIMIDVDGFKSINDQYGHIEGDRALKATADILRGCFAGRHFIARYGGDEFVVVMRDCKEEQMAQYCTKLVEGQIRYNNTSNKPYEIWLSIGAYVFASSEIVSLHRLYMKVDELMYQEKKAKRNANAQTR